MADRAFDNFQGISQRADPRKLPSAFADIADNVYVRDSNYLVRPTMERYNLEFMSPLGSIIELYDFQGINKQTLIIATGWKICKGT